MRGSAGLRFGPSTARARGATWLVSGLCWPQGCLEQVDERSLESGRKRVKADCLGFLGSFDLNLATRFLKMEFLGFSTQDHTLFRKDACGIQGSMLTR